MRVCLYSEHVYHRYRTAFIFLFSCVLLPTKKHGNYIPTILFYDIQYMCMQIVCYCIYWSQCWFSTGIHIYSTNKEQYRCTCIYTHIHVRLCTCIIHIHTELSVMLFLELSHEQSVKTEQLKNDWFREKRTLETDVARLKNDLQLANEWIASRNKRGGANPRDRSKSPSRGRQGGRSLERTKSPSLIAPEGVEGGSLLDMSSTPAVNFSSESSLESSMLEVREGYKLLSSYYIIAAFNVYVQNCP